MFIRDFQRNGDFNPKYNDAQTQCDRLSGTFNGTGNSTV